MTGWIQNLGLRFLFLHNTCVQQAEFGVFMQIYLWTVIKSAGRRGGCSKWPGQPRQSPSDRSWSLCAARRVPRCLPTAAATCRRQTRPGCTHLPSMTPPDHGGTWRWSSLAWRWFAGGPEANEVDAALEWCGRTSSIYRAGFSILYCRYAAAAVD